MREGRVVMAGHRQAASLADIDDGRTGGVAVALGVGYLLDDEGIHPASLRWYLPW